MTLDERVENLEDQLDGVIDVLEILAIALGYAVGVEIAGALFGEDE